ncbi:uncharacterized protein UV8b_01458 [Ustilaginoidea virens]|uniref:Uncharacterized protein n=1 Tax=Ustilaginoidea virens TaxID=1159556 RepID=A0A8E5HKZ3_USTVR|nr:uncharacterized protein UV8b_01458 [Ustilaginoidea virens]QUC17217.1 hypothetical protein UV8b_01458 [Ustilaginoidea virens]
MTVDTWQSQQAVDSSQQPTANSRQPTADSQQPTADTRQPAVTFTPRRNLIIIRCSATRSSCSTSKF